MLEPNLILQLLISLIGFGFAITIHELAHAWMADRLGDPTPRLMGRITLNPLAHYDPVGTTMLFGLMILRFLGFPVLPFGWAKPVMFDPYNLQNPRRDAALISLAGPLSNIAMATFFAILLRFTLVPFSPFAFFANIFIDFVYLNVVLAVFNLVPIHPLDGGKILVGLLPKREAYQLDKFLNQYGLILLILLVFPVFGGSSPVFTVLDPLINTILRLLLPQTVLI